MNKHHNYGRIPDRLDRMAELLFRQLPDGKISLLVESSDSEVVIDVSDVVILLFGQFLQQENSTRFRKKFGDIGNGIYRIFCPKCSGSGIYGYIDFDTKEEKSECCSLCEQKCYLELKLENCSKSLFDRIQVLVPVKGEVDC